MLSIIWKYNITYKCIQKCLHSAVNCVLAYTYWTCDELGWVMIGMMTDGQSQLLCGVFRQQFLCILASFDAVKSQQTSTFCQYCQRVKCTSPTWPWTIDMFALCSKLLAFRWRIFRQSAATLKVLFRDKFRWKVLFLLEISGMYNETSYVKRCVVTADEIKTLIFQTAQLNTALKHWQHNRCDLPRNSDVTVTSLYPWRQHPIITRPLWAKDAAFGPKYLLTRCCEFEIRTKTYTTVVL